MSPSLPVIGKPVVDNHQEEDDNEADDDDDDADNAEESDGEEFEQETGWMISPYIKKSLLMTLAWFLRILV